MKRTLIPATFAAALLAGTSGLAMAQTTTAPAKDPAASSDTMSGSQKKSNSPAQQRIGADTDRARDMKSGETATDMTPGSQKKSNERLNKQIGTDVDPHKGMTSPHAAVPGSKDMTRSAGVLTEVEDDDRIVDAYGISVDELKGMNVYGPSGDQIGEVEHVFADASGKIVAVTIEAGGFLGLGEKEIIVDLGKLQRDGDKLSTRMSQEELKALPSYDK